MSQAVFPYRRALVISPGQPFRTPAGLEVPAVILAIYVGGAGNISLVTPGGDSVLFSGVPAGTLLPVQCQAVNSASTTATNLVGLWG